MNSYVNRNLQRIIERKYGSSRPYSSGLRVNCPFCVDDSSYHLYICTKPVKYMGIKGLFVHCFKCGYSGTTQKLLGLTPSKLDSPLEYTEEDKVLKVPEGIFPLISASGFMAEKMRIYLKSRSVFDLSEIYYGLYGDWFGRIIFPVVENDKIVFWTGRTVLGANPKYLNSPGQRKHYMFNFDKAIHNPQLVICEGVFDALSIQGGIAIFGKEMTEDQIYRLISLYPKENRVIVGLDPDARVEALKLINRLSHFFPHVSLLDVYGKDIASSSSYNIKKLSDLDIIRLRLEKTYAYV